MRSARSPLAYTFLLTVLAQGTAFGATLTSDFDAGLPPGFSIVNGGLFSVETVGDRLRIHKSADDGSDLPDGFLSAGITSAFMFDGDYSVTVDFELTDFPVADGPAPASGDQLNESVLGVKTDDSNVSVLRFRLDASDKVEAYFSPPATPLGEQPSAITSGRYRLSRTGTTVTGEFAPAGSETFTLLTSRSDPDYGGPAEVRLVGVQGLNPGASVRSTTALDISFDNLVVVAESFILPGDANGDEQVNGTDYLIWADAYGDDPAHDPPGPPANGDFNEDGQVDGLDYLVWANNFGLGTDPVVPAPEPGAATLAILGITVAFVFTKRTR